MLPPFLTAVSSINCICVFFHVAPLDKSHHRFLFSLFKHWVFSCRWSLCNFWTKWMLGDINTHIHLSVSSYFGQNHLGNPPLTHPWCKKKIEEEILPIIQVQRVKNHHNFLNQSCLWCCIACALCSIPSFSMDACQESQGKPKSSCLGS